MVARPIDVRKNFQEGFGYYTDQNRSFRRRQQIGKPWKFLFKKLDIEGSLTCPLTKRGKISAQPHTLLCMQFFV